MIDFSVTGLRTLREVVARGSFTAAGEALGYTQSAVSRQIAELEKAADAALFERMPRGVRLTEAGRVLLRHADEVVGQLAEAERDLAGVRDHTTGRLRVGAFPTANAALIPRVLIALRSREPGVELSLREGTTTLQLRKLRSGAADVAVVGTPPGQPLTTDELVQEPLLDDPLLLAVSRDHPLARSNSVDLEELATEPWIAASANAGETFLGIWGDAAPWQPHVAFVVREWTAKLGLVAAGLGVTLLPGLAAMAVRSDVALVRIRSEHPTRRAVLLAVRRGAEPSPHVRAFVDLAHETAATLAVETQRRVNHR